MPEFSAIGIVAFSALAVSLYVLRTGVTVKQARDYLDRYSANLSINLTEMLIMQKSHRSL